MTDFNGKLDAHFRRLEAEEQRRIEAADQREQAIDDRAEEIEDDDELIEAAISDAMTQIGSPARIAWAKGWDVRWRTEQAALFRSRGNKDTTAMLEAAQGLCELMDEAVRDLAERQVAEGETDDREAA